jgi:hypothetical protein
MVAKKKAPAKAKKQPANEGKALQTKYQTLLGLISYGIPYYFVTAGTTEKQEKMFEAVREKWDELAHELNSIRNLQHDCVAPDIWCVRKSACMTQSDCDLD